MTLTLFLVFCDATGAHGMVSCFYGRSMRFLLCRRRFVCLGLMPCSDGLLSFWMILADLHAMGCIYYIRH